MSKLAPKYLLLIAEHSICHPGLPGPHFEFHDGSSFVFFHKTKSFGFFLFLSISTLEPESKSS